MSTTSEYWSQIRNEMANELDLSVFKNWRTVRSIPIYKDNEFPMTYPVEVEYMLRRRGEAEISRWKSVLKEPFLGHTADSYRTAQLKILDNTSTTSWVCKSAHHILTYEGMSGKNICEYDQIIEFGAGIGETARVIRDLGFSGEYHILDLPEIGRISSYYLGDKVKFHNVLEGVPLQSNRLFIATWSLSEVPEDYKKKVAAYFKNSDFLIIFQNEIFGYSNYNWFTNEFPVISNTEILLRQLVWHKGAGGNYYMYATNSPNKSNLLECTLPPATNHSVRKAIHLLRRAPKSLIRKIHRS